MSADVWHVANDDDSDDGGLPEIRNKNRLLVATAHDFDDARQIVREHNAYVVLLAALAHITVRRVSEAPKVADYKRLVDELQSTAREAIARAAKAEGTS